MPCVCMCMCVCVCVCVRVCVCVCVCVQVYYKEAVGALVVFDVTRVTTFEAVTKWKNDIDAKVLLPDNKPIPVVLLANKVGAGRGRVGLSVCVADPRRGGPHSATWPRRVW
jgi:hypothetical protein